jgi:sugar lactone lactonase YvrE
MNRSAFAVLALAAALPAGADTLVLVAGGGSEPHGKPPAECRLREPFGTAFDKSGAMYVVEMVSGQRVLKVGADGLLAVVAGDGTKGDDGDGGPAAKARFNGIHSLCVSAEGDLYLADTFNNKVRRIDAKTGVITTVAGSGAKAFSGDGGPAEKAGIGGAFCAELDPTGTRLYIADLGNRRVRMVDLKTGVITTVAGNGKKGVPADGADAKDSPLTDPRAVAVDSKGNLYILERGGHALRVVDPAGKIRTVVGASGKAGATGDGGDALAATLNGPKHICIDRQDNVIIADAENHLIRKYLPAEGKIVRVAGTGRKGAAGVGGPPDKAELARPHGVFVHADGTLYITDSYNNRVLKIVRGE